MLSIRLTRTGKIHAPHYRIVVQEKRSKLNGKSVDQIGHYHPATKGKELVIDAEKAKMWLSRGAQPSDTVTNLLVKQGVLERASAVAGPVKPKKVLDKPDAAAAPAPELSAQIEAAA